MIVTNDQADYYSGITSITVNGKNAYELKGKFLDDLQKNAFSGTHREDTVEHIEYFLKIVDPIDLPNVNQDKLRVVVFPISFARDAWRWFDGIKGSITSSKTGWPQILYTTKLWIYSLKELCGTTGSWGVTKLSQQMKKLPILRKLITMMNKKSMKFFRIETNLFDYETPLCEKFKEFNYLLKIDPGLLTKDIEGFKTYDEYKDDWIYEWNKNMPWVHEKPRTDTGVWSEPAPVVHYCKLFNYKSGYSEWPTCSWKEDGYCYGGNLPGPYIIGNSLHYQIMNGTISLGGNEKHERRSV
ncbi:hypothetical protein Tco_0729569 [Tanacetum coccineum]|uniref:Uncharacterized protein n=1 Tax=Tanacetum coccineum TaxID=301880 RepID=A0ABQ4YSU4_9ASTR